MSEELEVGVGSVEGGFPEKFIIAEEGEGELVYHAASLSRIGYHREIVGEQGYSWEQIPGGGKASYSPAESSLELYGRSGDFGPVPEEILAEFIPELKEAYEELGLEVEEVELSPSGFWSPEAKESEWGEYLELLE